MPAQNPRHHSGKGAKRPRHLTSLAPDWRALIAAAQGVIRDREVMKVCLLTNARTQALAAASLAAQLLAKSWP